MPISDPWSDLLEKEFLSLKSDINLKNWLLSLIQQNWPLSWIKGQKALKEIVNREITLELAEKLAKLAEESIQKPAVVLLSMENKISLNQKSPTKITKNTKISYMAKLGESYERFVLKEDTCEIPVPK